MEAVTAPEPGTGSKTMADLAGLAAEKHADKPALRHKSGDEWVEITYAELGEAISEVARGLIDLGIEHGEKVSIVSHTRPEWTFANLAIFAAGAVSVSVYQTNSPAECHYVIEHSESKAVFVEDGEQLGKIREVEDDLPNLEHIIVFEPGDADIGDAISLDDLRERGRGRDADELDQRVQAVGPDDLAITIYTSGTTGPPKGCLLTHGNYRDVTSMTESMGVLEEGEVVYLFLPLAHAFAKLIQYVALDLGGCIAFWEKDPTEDHPQPHRGQADLLPVGAADVREDLHAGHLQRRGPREAQAGGAARPEGAPGRGTTARRSPTRSARPSTRPTRSSTRTCARCSAATSASA